MNKYLEKIAKKDSDNDEGGGVSGTKRVLGGAGVGIAGTLAGAATTDAVNRNVFKSIHTKGVVDRGTLKKVLKHENLDTTFSPYRASGGNRALSTGLIVEGKKSGPIYVNKHSVNEDLKRDHPNLNARMNKHFVNMKYSPYHNPHGWSPGDNRSPVRNLDIAMHELGHAKDLNNRKKLGFLGIKPGLARSLNSPVAHLRGAAVGAALLSNKHTEDLAPVVPLALAVPALAPELRANYHAARMIARHGNKTMAAKYLANLGLKNTLSYGGMAFGTSAGLYAAKKLIKLRNKDKNDV